MDSDLVDLLTLNSLLDIVDKDLPVVMILLDLSNAFDKVCHEFLILRLKAAGVNEDVVQVIMGFLSHRSQTVSFLFTRNSSFFFSHNY